MARAYFSRSGSPSTCLGGDEGQQAGVLLVAGRAPLEMGAEARERRVGVGAFDLELDIAVEQLEARLAADLRADRPERSGDGAILWIGPRHDTSFPYSISLCSPTARPAAARWRRKLRRASCNDL
jgi:hypothetical protein